MPKTISNFVFRGHHLSLIEMAPHISLSFELVYVNNIGPEMVLPPGSENFNHNATRTTSSRSRSNNVNNSSGRRDVIGYSYEVNSLVFIAVTLPN